MKWPRASFARFFGFAAWACAFVWGLLAFTGAGCGGPRYPSCDNDEQCTNDTHRGVCVDHLCTECRASTGCPAGRECVAGMCKPGEGYCDDNTACAGGGDCQDHQCQKQKIASVPLECGDDKPCAGGSRCENGHCVGPPKGGPGCQNFPPPKFDYESPELHPETREVLQRLATCLSSGSLKGAKVLLTGHCDARGEYEFNMSLGAQRAENVKTFLSTLGVPADRVVTSSRGKLDATGGDDAGWANDRRVDIEVR
jgi:peptidoglycan-associated lipoprotein